MIFSVPNQITYGRIILIPIIVGLLAMIEPAGSVVDNQCYGLWATILFGIAGISDLVDGYYARKYGAVSLLGKFIDPMADKLIHMATLVMLVPLHRVPAWLVVVFLFREIFISGIRAVAAGEGLIIDAASWGKKKTAWFNFGIGGMIYYYPAFPGRSFEINIHAAAMVCFGIGLIYSVISALQYTTHFYNLVKHKGA